MSMSEQLTDIERSCKQAVASAQTLEELDAVRVSVCLLYTSDAADE